MLKKYEAFEMNNINKIGVIMWGLFGDVLIRTPVIRALKIIYPNSTISVVVDSIGKEVLKYNNLVDDIIVIDRNKKNKLKYNINKIIGIFKIRNEKFDLLVNLYNGGSSPTVVFLSNAKYRLGFCQQKNNFIYNVKNNCEKIRLKDEQRLSNYMISIVEPLSKKTFSLKPMFDITEQIIIDTGKFLEKIKYKKLYILNLASGDTTKILEFEKYLFLVKYIYQKYSYIPLIVSNPNQEYLQNNFINNFLDKNDLEYIKLPTMSLDKIAGLIKLTKFIITPDTGLMHLAMVFDNYIYTIFTYTHPIFVDPKNNKFISVYEKFDLLHQKQNILESTIIAKIDLLFERMENE